MHLLYLDSRFSRSPLNLPAALDHMCEPYHTAHGTALRCIGSPHAVLVVVLSLWIVAVIILLLPICILAVPVATILAMSIIPAVSPSLLVVVRLLIVIDVIALRVTVLVARLIFPVSSVLLLNRKRH